MADLNQTILFKLLGDSKSLQSATKQGQKGLGGLANAAKKVAGAAAVAFGGQQLLNWAGDAIQLASAAAEVDSKFDSVFGTAEDLTAALEAWGDMAGVTTTEAKSMAATFGNLAQAQGLSDEATEDLVMKVATLAGDMASFNDADPAQVFKDLNAAVLTTEREGMKKYGIALTETEIKQEALRIATAEGRSEFTKADKALASYNLAVKQAGKATGDLEKTQDSAANRNRQLQASMRELQEEIGRELLPVWEDLLEVAVDLLPLLKGVAAGTGNAVAPVRDLSKAVASATDEGSSWIDKLGAAKDAALALIDPVSSTVDSFFGVGEAAEDAAGKFKDFGSADRYIEDAILAAQTLEREAGEAMQQTAAQTEDAYRRVNTAVDKWVGVLGNLQRAYDETKRKADALAFLSPGGGDDRGQDPFAPGGEFGGIDFGDARTSFTRRNGPVG